MTDPRLHGHALIALGLAAMFAATPPERPAARVAEPQPAFVPLEPFDEQLVALPADSLDEDGDEDSSATTTTTVAPPDPASGLFAA